MATQLVHEISAGGQALGIPIMPDEIADALARPDHPAGAMTLVVEGATRHFTRIVFRESMFARGAHAQQRQSTVAHAPGHGFGLSGPNRPRPAWLPAA